MGLIFSCVMSERLPNFFLERVFISPVLFIFSLANSDAAVKVMCFFVLWPLAGPLKKHATAEIRSRHLDGACLFFFFFFFNVVNSY